MPMFNVFKLLKMLQSIIVIKFQALIQDTNLLKIFLVITRIITHKNYIVEHEIVARCASICEYFTADKFFHFKIIKHQKVIFTGRFSSPSKH